MYPLDAGLGAVTLKKDSLLSAARQTDAGGIFGNPPFAGAPANIRAENQARIHKLFHCILNYIVPNCRIYKMFMRDFGQNGIDVYRFIMVYGSIPTPPRALRTNEDAWSRMTMDTLNLSYTLYNYILWAEIILEQGRLLTKTGVQMKEKFLSGLPSFFNAEKAQMRHDNLHVYPATYGGIPEFAATSRAAIAHPRAGQPDIYALMRTYIPDFMNKSQEIEHKKTPSGYVRQLTLTEGEDAADGAQSILDLAHHDGCPSVNLASTDVTDSTSCHLCGGKGHGTSQILPDGSKLFCTTKLLQDIKAGKSVDGSTDVNKFRDKAQRYKKAYQQSAQEITSLKDQVTKLTNTRQSLLTRATPSAQQLTTDDSDDSSIPDQNLDDIDMSSDGSSVGPEVFAEQIQRGGKKKFIPRRK